MPDTLVNEHPALAGPQPVKLTRADFWLLKRAGAFEGYSKSELLEGELWGVPVEDDESDAVCPIKLRIKDYLRLHEAGAFKRYARTELLDGLVYAMSPQYRPHMFPKDELAYRLRRALEATGNRLFVGTEGSVALSDIDLPLPDILLTDDPRGAGPVPGSSIRLLVEIAVTSLDHDLSHKARVYADRGVPEYWVLDVNDGVIHQMWSAQGKAYADGRDVKLGERIEAATIEGLVVETDGIN
ncbi:MAG TPA: Uma2 family endonuclease [Allosphingosinicella sp.]|jgi:Uma2 family endonuclease